MCQTHLYRIENDRIMSYGFSINTLKSVNNKIGICIMIYVKGATKNIYRQNSEAQEVSESKGTTLLN